ncbi:MAG: hypothetical protein ACYTHJ_10830 [Planctomycetota bacterium]|jgi:hypothetical protein
MLVFEELKAPRSHGEVLVAPESKAWERAATANHDALGSTNRMIAGRTMGEWRNETRKEFLNGQDRLLVVLGHQPAFIHPGVWAKHVVADRLARAVGGLAMNLIVDCDVPKSLGPRVPRTGECRLALQRLSFPVARPRIAYEQIPAQTSAQIDGFESELRKTLGSRYDSTQLPVYLEGMRQCPEPEDWVDQAVAGRRAIDLKFGITLWEERVSHHWCTPLVSDMVIHAPEFSASYNRALAIYRRQNGISGQRRPMPDLSRTGGRSELPLWFFKPDSPRRRALVERNGGQVLLYADDLLLGGLDRKAAASPGSLREALATLGGWQLRPRALALTLWARLLLADLFVHGIGGAKYDRVTDEIIRDYYGVEAPIMTCTSATLHLDLPNRHRSAVSADELKSRIRDLAWNPQRHLAAEALDRDLLRERKDAVRQSLRLRSDEPRNHGARRSVFRRIRDINKAMLESSPDALERAHEDWTRAVQLRKQEAIAAGREYFFALFDDKRLTELLDALPVETDFRL